MIMNFGWVAGIMLALLATSAFAGQKERKPKPPISYSGPPLPENGANANLKTGSQTNGSVTVQTIIDYDVAAQQSQLDAPLPPPDPTTINFQDSVQTAPAGLTGNGLPPPSPPPSIGVCGIVNWTNANGHFQCASGTWAATRAGCISNFLQCP